MLPIYENQQGRREIHPTSIYLPDLSSLAGERMFRRDLSGVRAPTAAGPVARSVDHSRRRHNDCGKEGRRQSRFQWPQKLKGCKVVAFCDRRCNVIAPFVVAPGNHNESPMLREGLPALMKTAQRSWPGTTLRHRQARWCLRLPGESQGHLQLTHPLSLHPVFNLVLSHPCAIRTIWHKSIMADRITTCNQWLG